MNDTFEVSIQRVYSPGPPQFACAAIVSRFSWIVPLPVYGLTAGTYHYNVNGGEQVSYDMPALPDEIEIADGELAGSFVLSADNILERTAPEYPYVLSLPDSESVYQ